MGPPSGPTHHQPHHAAPSLGSECAGSGALSAQVLTGDGTDVCAHPRSSPQLLCSRELQPEARPSPTSHSSVHPPSASGDRLAARARTLPSQRDLAARPS